MRLRILACSHRIPHSSAPRELLPAVTEVDRIVGESIDGRPRANTHESGDVEVIERLVRKYSKVARGGLRPMTPDRLEALCRDDGQDEEQGTEQQQR
jgi:hypothetical protein